MTTEITDPIASVSVYKDQLGGWAIHYLDHDTGDEDYRAASSETIATRYARETYGITRWSRRGKYSKIGQVAE